MYQVKLIILGLLLIFVSPASAWWNTDWENRREIQINNTLGSELTYYQVYINLSDNPINSTSLRIVNESSGNVISHWQETILLGNCTGLWFNATTIPAAVWLNETYYIYYRNVGAASDWDIMATFVFGDDFNDGNLDGSKWNVITSTNTYIEADGVLTAKRVSDAGYSSAILSIATFSRPFILEFDYNIAASATMFGVHDDTNEPSYTHLVYGTHHSSSTHQSIYEDGSDRGSIGSHAKGVLYSYRYDVKPTGCNYIRDGNAYYNSVYSSEDVLKAGFTLSACGSDEFYIDNVRVRKYAANPPTYAFGTEETVFIPPIPINLDYSKGFFWVNHTWDAGIGNVSDSYNILHNNIWYNETINTYYNSGDIGDGGYSEILIYAYNNSDCLSEGYVTQNISAPLYIPPPTPINLQHTKDEYWVNHTWAEGADGLTMSYNVSHNGTWTNGSNNAWFNSGGVGRNGISTIIIYAYNGMLSEGYITQTISTKLGIGYEEKISNKNIQSIYFPLMSILFMFIVVGAFKYMFMSKK